MGHKSARTEYIVSFSFCFASFYFEPDDRTTCSQFFVYNVVVAYRKVVPVGFSISPELTEPRTGLIIADKNKNVSMFYYTLCDYFTKVVRLFY